MQPAADIFRLDDLRDASRILLLHGVSRRSKTMKPLLNRLGVDEGVRIMEGIKHVAKNAEQLLGLGVQGHLQTKPLIHSCPIQVVQRKERILFSKRLPEDSIIRNRCIGERLAARFRPGASTAK